MTILTIPQIGDGDALGGVGVNDAQLQIEPHAVFVEDFRESRATVVPDRHFVYNQVIRRVLLPSTLRTIGRNVFSRMESLEEIDLSHTAVETIGTGFLSNSVSVEVCRFPSTLRMLGDGSLLRTSIKRVDLFHTLLSFLPIGFLSFSPVEVLLVPPSLNLIDDSALQVTSLRRLDFSHTQLKWIGDQVLSCSPVVEVRLPTTVTSIAPRAFEHTQLRRLWIDEEEVQWVNEPLLGPEVRELRLPFCISWLHSGCLCRTQLRRVDLACTNVKSTQAYVLSDNPYLEQVFLPRCLCSIDRAFLNHNPKLRFLDLRFTQVSWIKDDFLLGTPIEEIWFPDTLCSVGKRFLYGARVTTLDLSKTFLTSIGTDFLQQCDQLHTLLLPPWVIDIPANLACTGRTAEVIVLPPTIGFLGTLPFQTAPFLRLIDLSQTAMEELPSCFLSNAPNLIDVRLPKSLRVIWDNVFTRTSLQKVNLLQTKIFYIGAGFCEFSPLKRLHVPQSFSQKLPELARVIRRSSSQVETALQLRTDI